MHASWFWIVENFTTIIWWLWAIAYSYNYRHHNIYSELPKIDLYLQSQCWYCVSYFFFPNMLIFIVWNLCNQKCWWRFSLVLTFQHELYLPQPNFWCNLTFECILKTEFELSVTKVTCYGFISCRIMISLQDKSGRVDGF